MSGRAGPCDITASIASTETLRLITLPTLDVFYTPLEERFERITRTARRLFGVSVAAVTILSREKQWFKSVNGWSISELPTEKSLCALVIRDGRQVIIPETRKDPRVAQHPLVVGKPHFGFYAGSPLRDKTGTAVGTFCVFDTKPRPFGSDDVLSLQDMTDMAQQEILTDQLHTAQGEIISKLGVARREAMFDPLTRVWNRRGAIPFLRTELIKAEETDTNLSICAIDVDNFKHINDNYGHQAGDRVLSKLAACLVRSVRTGDIVCRQGGDEFMLILPGSDRKSAKQVAERVRRIVSESPIRTRDGNISITVSIGCASRRSSEHIAPDDLIERADEALRSSKNAGRDRISVAR